ncbi:PocR ligand-binding domain-containing protein [Magnetovibrio blakemorei]|uniref:PocR ligand-binding domain-containing protein n=1 Tax=Magnetovibrio blakemorei TaxID=28181 RepID=UPI00147D7453|nr:PocR ligand-binding domain-containing protein [Magnetovibrio blakemorei]
MTPKFLNFSSLSGKLLAIYMPLTVVAVLSVFGVLEVGFYRGERARLIENLTRAADGQTAAIEAAVWDFDIQAVRKLLEEQSHLPFLQSAQVFDENGKILAAIGETGTPPRASDFRIDRPLQHTSVMSAKTIGRLVLTVHDDGIRAALYRHLWINGAILLVLMSTLIAGTIFGVRAVISRPLEEFRNSIGRSPEEQLAAPLHWERQDELGDVLRAYHVMLEARHRAETAMVQREEELRMAVIQAEAARMEAEAAERLLRDKVEEIERFNHLAVGRELRIIELKKQMNTVLEDAGRALKFDPGNLLEEALVSPTFAADGDIDFETVKTEFVKLLNENELQNLFTDFCKVAGVPAAIIDLEANVLASSPWQRACTDFHRVNNASCARCIESDTELSLNLTEGKNYAMYRCKNGMTDCASPIVIAGHHVANVFIGQFHTNHLDEAFFKAQAEDLGFDVEDYLAAVREAPVMDEHSLPAILGFLARFSKLMGAFAIEQWKALKGKENVQQERIAAMNLAEDAEMARAELDAYKDQLEDLVEERTAELRDSEGRTRLLLESVGEGVFGVDNEGRVTFLNPEAIRLLGYEAEELLGQKVHAIIHHTHPDGTEYDVKTCPMYKSYTFGESHRIEDEVLWRKDGTRFEVEYHSTPIMKDGEITGAVISFADISIRKEAEAKLQDAYGVISDSITYASSIQRSVLTGDDTMTATMSDHLVLWEPRDVVGGDIYWCHLWGDGVLVALADCTGHGVPGAFMTLIASGALDRAMTDVPPGQVGEMIQRMHQIIQVMLGQHGDRGESDDGLEMGACFLHGDLTKMTFAGARFSLFSVKDGAVDEIKGTKKGIGYRGILLGQTYAETELSLQNGASFYMSSDGFLDQVGGERRRMFGKKRFKELLLSMEDLPFAEQKKKFYKTLLEYQGEDIRRDDVSVVGFKV